MFKILHDSFNINKRNYKSQCTFNDVFFSSPSSSQLKTWYMTEPEPSLARKSHFLPSLSRAHLGYPPCFWARAKPGSKFKFVAEPRQASSDFLAQAGSEPDFLKTFFFAAHKFCTKVSHKENGEKLFLIQKRTNIFLYLYKLFFFAFKNPNLVKSRKNLRDRTVARSQLLETLLARSLANFLHFVNITNIIEYCLKNDRYYRKKKKKW